MSYPTRVPEHIGSQCWENRRSDELISKVALVDAGQSNNFLACHSPIAGINSLQGVLTETQVFEALFNRQSRETLAVITGEPGSGKSHLINWLKLRLDDALSRKEKQRIKSVMIKRRAGSLRDALEQLVEQLPGFRNYVDPIRAAIVTLTSTNARRELCLHLSTLLHESPLSHRRLRNLHDFFSDPGSLKWLCREGGAIDRNVQRLISRSELEERESLPSLADEDLLIGDPRIRALVSASVQDLLDVISADSEFCVQALSRANEFLRPALARLTGLGNQTLHQILRSIRQDLKKQGESLALFVEDVSTLSALDTEIVNALEPQNDPSLCRMYGVLGMTNQALKRLPENMQGRIDLVLEIKGSDDSGPFQADSNYIDRFVARYLNALRLANKDIERIARFRREGSDVRISACEECKMQPECFALFGKVDIEDQEIGLFPFRPGTAQRLLRGLHAEGAIRRNPRGLLEHVVTPVVGAIERGIERAPVNLGMPVDPVSPRDLGAARGRYLGGWDEQSVQRLNYLVWYWTGTDSLADGAATIEALRDALRLPKLSQKPQVAPRPPNGKDGKEVTPTPTPTPPPAPPPEYSRFLSLLDKWQGNNDPLRQDAKFREMVLPLIKSSIPWDDMRQPAEPARARVNGLNVGAVEIEEMVARPAIGGIRFSMFPRSDETAGLLRVGLRFAYLGRYSWAYQDSVPDRRLLGRWIRANTDSVAKVIEPADLDPMNAVSVAITFLILAYQFNQRKPMPVDYSDAVNALFSFETAIPATLSKELGTIAADLPERANRVREFVSAELNVPQGAGGVNFIDPIPIVRTLEGYGNDCVLNQIDPRFNESFWAPRFKAVIELSRSSWANLGGALTNEKQQIEAVYQRIASVLSRWDLSSSTVADQLREFVDGCKDVKLALSESKQALGDAQAEKILSRNDNPVATWSKVLREIETIADGVNSIDVLRFRTEELIDLRDSLTALDAWASELDKLVNDSYKKGTGGGDLDTEIQNAHAALEAIASLTKPTEAKEADVKA